MRVFGGKKNVVYTRMNSTPNNGIVMKSISGLLGLRLQVQCPATANGTYKRAFSRKYQQTIHFKNSPTLTKTPTPCKSKSINFAKAIKFFKPPSFGQQISTSRSEKIARHMKQNVAAIRLGTVLQTTHPPALFGA